MAEKFVFDLTSYKDRRGGRVPEGTYKVAVEDVEIAKISQGENEGKPMINLWLRVVGGEFDGVTIMDRLPQTEKALFRTANFLQAIGMKTPKKRIQLDLSSLVGKYLEVSVVDGTPFRGDIKSEVRSYARTSKAEKATEKDVEDLDSGDEEETSAEETSAEETTSSPSKEKAEEADQGEVDLDSINEL